MSDSPDIIVPGPHGPAARGSRVPTRPEAAETPPARWTHSHTMTPSPSSSGWWRRSSPAASRSRPPSPCTSVRSRSSVAARRCSPRPSCGSSSSCPGPRRRHGGGLRPRRQPTSRGGPHRATIRYPILVDHQRYQEPSSVPILDRLHDPAELRGMSEPELAQLPAEIRETIIRTVAVTGDISGRRWVSSRSPSPSTASWSRRATGSCGTPATRRTPTAADRPPVALPHPAPDRRHRRLPAAQRVAARRVRRRPRRDRAVSIARASPRPGHAHSMERIAVVVATPRCCQAVRSRRSTTSATADPAPDRAQRQRECRARRWARCPSTCPRSSSRSRGDRARRTGTASRSGSRSSAGGSWSCRAAFASPSCRSPARPLFEDLGITYVGVMRATTCGCSRRRSAGRSRSTGP